jgi:glycosyltransferase involved in cell wall biosynthesis
VTGFPSVGVVLPTRNRPAGVRTALAAVLGQDYPGEVRSVVVFDRAEPDRDLAADPRVSVLANERTPGLAGARNTGVLALDTDLVAFCDDDDRWLAGKLRSQVEAMLAVPGAEFASCGILVRYGGHAHRRLAGRDQVRYQDLLRSRMVMVHASTYLMRRESLCHGIGLVDESIPGSHNEDWDLALRAARRTAIVHVDQPLVEVNWSDSSFFARQWDVRAAGLLWMLRHHPDIASCRPGAGRVYGQLAFAHACLAHRAEAWRWSRRALLRNWREPRVPLALAVACGAVSGDVILRMLHSRGHGI